MSTTPEPTRLEELPTVLDELQARSVLRCGEKKLRELITAGRLGRLGYSATILIDSLEIRRFLRSETTREAAARVAAPPLDPDSLP